MTERHVDLPRGTILTKGKGLRIKIREMRGDWAYVEHVRKDGERDQRYTGWSGCLGKDWSIER